MEFDMKSDERNEFEVKIEPCDQESEFNNLPPPPPPMNALSPGCELGDPYSQGATPKKVKHSGPGRPLTADRKRPYPCSKCPSKFGSKMELEEHQNSHTGEKPFECDICHSRFNRRSTLWNHKRIHSDTKPFTCPVCNMTFKWKNSLKCHKDMHMRKNELGGGELEANLRLTTYAGGKAEEVQIGDNGHIRGPPNKRSKKLATETVLDTGSWPTDSIYNFHNPHIFPLHNIMTNQIEPLANNSLENNCRTLEGLGAYAGISHGLMDRPSSGSACSNASHETYSPPSDPTPSTLQSTGYSFGSGNTTTGTMLPNSNSNTTTAQSNSTNNIHNQQYTSSPESMLSVHVIHNAGTSPQQAQGAGNAPPTPMPPHTLQLPPVPYTMEQNNQVSQMYSAGLRSTVPGAPQQALYPMLLGGGDAYLPNVDYVLNQPYSTRVAPAPLPPTTTTTTHRDTLMVDGSFIVKVWPTNEW